jgi:hypothetical protein
MTTKKLDELANLYNKTKKQKYKDLWYKEVKELANGIGYHRSERRAVSLSEIRKERN